MPDATPQNAGFLASARRRAFALLAPVTDLFRKDPAGGDSSLNPNARDLRTNPAGYIRPSEVTTVIADGKPVEKVISAVTVEQAYKASTEAAEAAKKSGYTMRVFKAAGKLAAGVAALVVAYKAASALSRSGKPQPAADDTTVAEPQAAFAETPANEAPANHWQNVVKAGRGQAPQVAGALNPKMNVMPADKVQDLGSAPMVRK